MGAVLTWVDFALPPVLLVLALLLSPLPAKIVGAVAQRQGKGRHKGYEAADDCHDGQAVAPQGGAGSAGGYIVPAQIHHARMLPSDAAHQFRYPGLYYAFELHALEGGELDCTPGFKWNGLLSRQVASSRRSQLDPRRNEKQGYAATKLHPADFGRKAFTGVSQETQSIISGSILLKLLYELRLRNYLDCGPQDVDLSTLIEGVVQPWDAHVGQIWATAMPTLFGLAGFNPLTVYYVYRPGLTSASERGPLWLAVLEVHNTFNERHIYVCEIDKPDQGPQPRDKEKASSHRGYEYFWEFPRTFHVSPFNDRSGCYQLYLNDLWRDGERLPTIDVRLLLMSPTDENDAAAPLQKKLMATLTSSQATSPTLKTSRTACELTAFNVLAKIAAQPLDLFLPVGRIMWEAAKLHWRKKLPVYMRPEPHGGAWTPQESTVKEQAFDGVGWPIALNPVGQPRLSAPSVDQTAELGATASGVARGAASGGIYWNDESFVESTCRKAIFRLFEAITREGPIKTIAVRSRNAEQSDVLFRDGNLVDIAKDAAAAAHQRKTDSKAKQAPDLTFYTLSSAMYVDLCLLSPQLAHLVGSRAERMWGVSSLDAYRRAMTCAAAADKRLGLRVKAYRLVAKWVRTSYVRWSLSKAGRDKSEAFSNATIELKQMARADSHPLDAIADERCYIMSGWSLLLLLALLLNFAILFVMAAASTALRVRYVRTPWAAIGEAREILAKEKSADGKAAASNSGLA